MNISVKSEYALEAIFDLAARYPGEPVRIADIAERQKIPQKFLELILTALKRGGFVESRRGADGGYLLARAPEKITLGEVLRFMESPRRKKPRGRGKTTPFTAMWQSVNESVSEVIDHTTFAELVRDWAERRSRYLPDWQI